MNKKIQYFQKAFIAIYFESLFKIYEKEKRQKREENSVNTLVN